MRCCGAERGAVAGEPGSSGSRSRWQIFPADFAADSGRRRTVMAETNQPTPGPHSRRKTGATLVGERHRDMGAGNAVEEVKDMGTELIGAVCDGATSLFEEQRRRAAGEIAAFGDALRRSAQSL